MKTTLRYLIITIFLLKIISYQCFGQREQLVVNLTNPSVPGYFSFDNPKGSVKITGYNGEVILITAVSRFSAENETDRFTGQAPFKITAEEKNNRIMLYCLSNNKTIDFNIKMPRQFSIKVSSFDNGKIEIINIAGDIEASNPAGDIILDQISGAAVVNSINGKISASFVQVRSDSPMMFTSLEGSIEIYLPEKVNAGVKMRSQYGELFSEFKLKPFAGRNTGKRGVTGNLITTEGWTVGMLNNGGPEYLISTFNGNIRLKKYHPGM